jgi:hypothetical protein
MKTQLLQILMKGIIGGAFAGFLIGAYVVTLSEDHVIQRDNFNLPLVFEQARQRYTSTVILAFTTVFAAIGPFIAAASFGRWIRHVVYGLTGSVAVVVGGALIAAAILNEEPFNSNKIAKSTCIDLARIYFLPAALGTGPVIGLLIGHSMRRSDKSSPTNSRPSAPPAVS